jgi:hypothetical protein
MMYWKTVNEALEAVLKRLMKEPLFASFRLVGGTCLSLQRGHRISVDIDMFTDAEYGAIDFGAIDRYLRESFDYVFPSALPKNAGPGLSYIVGGNEAESVKLDLYYTEPFIWPMICYDNIRMAAIEEIAAMKIDIVQRMGRKKDFWDLDELTETFSLTKMIEFHELRYPFNHDENLIKKNLTNFSNADDDFDPECMKGKVWEIIKLDIVEQIEAHL